MNGRRAAGRRARVIRGKAARFFRGWLLGAPWLLATAGQAQSPTAFDAIVAPIFEARCVSCHGADKTKGRLALHTWERVVKGGASGPLWVAGKPAESELVRRLLLPADDEERMPPSDEPQLAREEIALLERWVAAGASPSIALADLKLSPELLEKAAGLAERLRASGPGATVRDAVWELDPTAVAAARQPLAQRVAAVQQRFPGALGYESRTSAELHFTTTGLGREFGDADLALLRPLADALVVLDLSGSAVTDRSAELLREFRALRVLRLNRTDAGDGVAAALRNHPRLEVLALHGSAISAAGLRALQAAGALRKVHIGGQLGQEAAQAGLPVVATGSEALDRPAAAEAAPAPAGERKAN